MLSKSTVHFNLEKVYFQPKIGNMADLTLTEDQSWHFLTFNNTIIAFFVCHCLTFFVIKARVDVFSAFNSIVDFFAPIQTHKEEINRKQER